MRFSQNFNKITKSLLNYQVHCYKPHLQSIYKAQTYASARHAIASARLCAAARPAELCCCALVVGACVGEAEEVVEDDEFAVEEEAEEEEVEESESESPLPVATVAPVARVDDC
jgi:hypothetical protein